MKVIYELFLGDRCFVRGEFTPELFYAVTEEWVAVRQVMRDAYTAMCRGDRTDPIRHGLQRSELASIAADACHHGDLIRLDQCFMMLYEWSFHLTDLASTIVFRPMNDSDEDF